jgi:uncharacterized protein YaaQ
MTFSTLRGWIGIRLQSTDGAVTVDWVVLSALVVTLLAAGYGFLRDGTTGLATGTSEYMTSFRN